MHALAGQCMHSSMVRIIAYAKLWHFARGGRPSLVVRAVACEAKGPGFDSSTDQVLGGRKKLVHTQ